MQAERRLRFGAAAASLLLCGGVACEKEPVRSFDCPRSEQVTHLEGVHYEGLACDDAIARAEARPTAAYYRKACEQLAPRKGVPPRVEDAYVASCRPAAGEDGGSLLDIDVCCPALARD